MRIAVVSLFPKALDCISNFGVTGKAIKDGLITVQGINPRAYAVDKHGSVDDRPYGGGPGMLMRPEPLKSAIKEARQKVKGWDTCYISSNKISPIKSNRLIKIRKNLHSKCI